MPVDEEIDAFSIFYGGEVVFHDVDFSAFYGIPFAVYVDRIDGSIAPGVS